MSDKPSILWTPHPGPQTEFLRAGEFEVLYGGAAGGGKSDATLFGGLRYTQFKNYRGLFLRRTYPELVEMIDRSKEFYDIGGKWNKTEKRWTFPSGATYEFGYFDKWDDRMRYQGQQYQYVAWDELGQVPEERYWLYLASRCRSPADSRMVPIMRGTANPGGPGHGWLMQRFVNKCGLDGSTVFTDPSTGFQRRFIPAKVADNPSIMENDPDYVKRLMLLPERLQLQLLDGRWDVAVGLALMELDASVHYIGPSHELYEPQPYWQYFCAFDWGYYHPAVWGLFGVTPSGTIVLVDSLHMWMRTPQQQADRIAERLWDYGEKLELAGPLRPMATYASKDCWNKIRSRGEHTPTTAERFQDKGIVLTPANQDRVAGLNNIREFVTVVGPGNMTKDPKFLIRRTASNQRVWDCLTTIPIDEKDREDALKRDADPENGEGGDDAYDMVRYGLASRMRPKPKSDPRLTDRNYDHQYEEVMKRFQQQLEGTISGSLW